MHESPTEPTFTQLQEVLESQFEIPLDSVTTETTLEQLGLDSLELVELTLIMEVDVDPADFAPTTTLGEVVHRMSGQGQAPRTADAAAPEPAS